jgi:hypothetical protein
MVTRKNMYTRKGRKKIKPVVYYIVLSVILLLILIISSLLDRSPVRMFGDLWNQVVFGSNVSWKTMGAMKRELNEKDSLILDLQTQMGLIEQVQGSNKGVVQIDSDYLNMRSEPKLNGKVIEKIPVGTLVDILYYHGDTDRLDEEFGRWCKITYNGKEGWVWGNYISIVE